MKTQPSNIDLSNELTRLARKTKSLKASMPSNPTAPNDYVEMARIESEIDEIKNAQTAIAKELIERDKAATERKKKHLEDAIKQGGNNAKELSKKLTEFADKLSLVTNNLAAEYAEILELSQSIRKTNSLMLHSNMPQVATLRIEPNNLHKIVKTQLVKTFGADTVNVFTPISHGVLGDIVETVKEISTHES